MIELFELPLVESLAKGTAPGQFRAERVVAF